MASKNKTFPVRGFTLIELLVVISIIGLLSTIVVATLGNVRTKARDTKRAADMQSILLALNLYYDQYNCLPTTSGSTCGPAQGTYIENNAGGWDYSSQNGFMTFLKTAGIMSSVPVDPINNMTGDGGPVGTYAYNYYCYSDGITLSYWKESGQRVYKMVHPNDYVPCR